MRKRRKATPSGSSFTRSALLVSTPSLKVLSIKSFNASSPANCPFRRWVSAETGLMAEFTITLAQTTPITFRVSSVSQPAQVQGEERLQWSPQQPRVLFQNTGPTLPSSLGHSEALQSLLRAQQGFCIG